MQPINLDTMRKGRDSHSVALAQFILLFGRKSDAVFCFVEGKDDSKYYEPRIHSIFSDTTTHILPCGGKAGVTKLYDLIRNKADYVKAKTMYFVDRDYDPLLGNPDIFETPCYSIENLYSSLRVFSRIIKTEFGISEDMPEYCNCMNTFTLRRNEFHRCVTLLNAWIACHRDLSSAGSTLRLNIGDWKLEDFVSIDLDKVSSAYTVDMLRARFHDTNVLALRTVSRKIKHLKSTNPERSFRGKFELEFFRVILEKLKHEAGSKVSTYFSQPIKIVLQLTRANLISELSQYAETPAQLIEYLTRKFDEYTVELSKTGSSAASS